MLEVSSTLDSMRTKLNRTQTREGAVMQVSLLVLPLVPFKMQQHTPRTYPWACGQRRQCIPEEATTWRISGESFNERGK